MPKRLNTLEPGWGARLREAREAAWNPSTRDHGFSQAEMASALGIRNTAVSKWEREEVASIDERSLVSMENLLGFNRAFIERGELPMVWEVRPSEVAKMVVAAAGGAVTHTILVQAPLGMSPVVQTGDVLFASRINYKEIRPGALLVVHPTDDTVIAGRATQVRSTGKWLLYRLEDQADPGSYSPIPLEDGQDIDLVSLVARKP